MGASVAGSVAASTGGAWGSPNGGRVTVMLTGGPIGVAVTGVPIGVAVTGSPIGVAVTGGTAGVAVTGIRGVTPMSAPGCARIRIAIRT